MINLKNDKGVTLLVLTITIIVLLIITSITIGNAKNQLGIGKVNNLYSDLDSISTKVSDYYLKNNSLPVFENNIYMNSKNELGVLFESNGGEKSVINSNDDGAYYVIDLSKLENLTLNYGSDYKNWSESSTFQTYQDLYIINGVTHQIYYPKGITYSGNVYFTKENEGTNVEQAMLPATSDEFKISNVDANKNRINGTDTVVINAKVTLSIGENYNKDTLEYAWKVKGDTENISYSPVQIESNNIANISSKAIAKGRKYTLYFKILDQNGNEHIANQDVTIVDPFLLAIVDDLGTSSTIYLYGNSDEVTRGSINVTLPDNTSTTIEAVSDNTTISESKNYISYNVKKNGTYIFTSSAEGYETKTTVKVSNVETFTLVDTLRLSYYNTEQKAYNYNGVSIPKGFYVDVNSKEDTGIVITDKIDDEGYSLGNEWVWVPVNSKIGNNDFYTSETASLYGASSVKYNNYGKLYSFSSNNTRDDYGTFYPIGAKSETNKVSLGKPSEEDGRYREPAILVNAEKGEAKNYSTLNKRGTTTKFSDLESLAKQYVNDYDNMVSSVKKYGGFYIGRYELSGTSENGSQKKSKVLRGQTWHNAYNTCMTFDKENVNSSMIYGSLWDATMSWLAKSGIQVGYTGSITSGCGNFYAEDVTVKNSSTTINVKNSNNYIELETGATTYTRTNNIFDLCGNLYEWTQEAAGTGGRVVRGGSYGYKDANYEYMANRGYNYPDAINLEYSSRPCLYIN